MRYQYKKYTPLFVFFFFMTFTLLAGGEEETTKDDKFHELVGKTVKITHVDFKGLKLPATNLFDIQFIDREHCSILINGQKHEGTWKYNQRNDTLDVTDVVLGSITTFVYEKSTHQFTVTQKVNEEQMHRMIVSVLR